MVDRDTVQTSLRCALDIVPHTEGWSFQSRPLITEGKGIVRIRRVTAHIHDDREFPSRSIDLCLCQERRDSACMEEKREGENGMDTSALDPIEWNTKQEKRENPETDC